MEVKKLLKKSLMKNFIFLCSVDWAVLWDLSSVSWREINERALQNVLSKKIFLLTQKFNLVATSC